MNPRTPAPSSVWGRQKTADPERLAADRRLHELLVAERFTGRNFELFRDDLWRYGWNTVRAWMRDGTIYARCYAQQVIFTAHPSETEELRRRADLREDIAARCVEAAIEEFIKLLEAGFWKPEKGASIRTLFIGQCLHRFRDAYRRWAGPYRRELRTILGMDRESRELGLEKRTILRESLNLILAEASWEARAICELMLTTDATQEEIGQRLGGKSRKSIERHLSRLRGRAHELAAAGLVVRPSTSSAVAR